MQLFRNGCLICGDELVYQDDLSVTCSMCGRKFRAEVSCAQGHFVCDDCHAAPAEALIEKICLESVDFDPLQLAHRIMKQDAIKMHGPEHHFLVAACLLVSFAHNTGQTEHLSSWMQKAKQRAKKLPGGFCGTHGNCGAGVGAGIFVSIISNASPLSGVEWQLSNLMTAKSLHSIAMSGGPRCCKRDTYLSIIEAVAFVHEHFKYEMPVKDTIICEFSHLNGQCKKLDCKFYSNKE